MGGLKLQSSVHVTPQCYAYTTPTVTDHAGWCKIGFTERDPDVRIAEQTKTAGISYKKWWSLKAQFMSAPFGTFTDRAFHGYLARLGTERKKGTEWFRIDPNMAKHHFLEFALNHGEDGLGDGVIPYILREEQRAAVAQTVAYFKENLGGECLWNAKPRFGKTLSAYDLCLRLKAQNVLIVTNRPAIANSWYDDYATFLGPSSGYVFVSHVDGIKDKPGVYTRAAFTEKAIDEEMKGCIEFVSLQDLKGSIYFGGEHDKLKELTKDSGMTWDVLIIDEAHEGVDTYKTDVAFNQISRKWTLHLSGTPFKALASEKFEEEAIFNWTYADEQRAKRDWQAESPLENPYEHLPKLHLLTYQLSDMIKDRLKGGMLTDDGDAAAYAFDLNEFFKTKESGVFVYDADVNVFLDALTNRGKFPFSTPELRDEIKHSFWLFNRVASAKAMAKKLAIHPVFKDYKVILAAGDGKMDEDEVYQKSFDKVREAISTYDKTITLSVGQLTTGVTIPEWTAVFMLSNMASPALYMQAAFRAQNPCLFYGRDGEAYRKKNAYVFDFDPARTLKIFETFANDLIPETSGERGSVAQRKQNIRELLNFFPVYGEDDAGEMVTLDAEAVLTIPRRIHAKEVVDRGFMSNFLFANISNIFRAPKEVIDMLNNMEPLSEVKPRTVAVDDQTAEDLYLNDQMDVEMPKERIVGLSKELFGEKIYKDVEAEMDDVAEDLVMSFKEEKALSDVKRLREEIASPIRTGLIEKTKDVYGGAIKKSTEAQMHRLVQEKTDAVVNKAYGDYMVEEKQLKAAQEKELKDAQAQSLSMAAIAELEANHEAQIEQKYTALITQIKDQLIEEGVVEAATNAIVKTVEEEKLTEKKTQIEGDVRDHLRGFSRTIPAFLMAYGDEHTTLENFDSLVPADVFFEVTMNITTGKGTTLEEFCFLRDGGDYYEKDAEGNLIKDVAHKKHFEGGLFDAVVFNDAVAEFMKRKKVLANYFDETVAGDIFDYIPPQRTNQIFTPKAVVVDMVNKLEAENPGCFDDPNGTFCDLYMKSGLYVTEIVKRLFNSETLRGKFSDERERLNHIFANQVFGCAPTEIIYRICLNYILGFSETFKIEHHHIQLFDTLASAKAGTLQEDVATLFGLES